MERSRSARDREGRRGGRSDERHRKAGDERPREKEKWKRGEDERRVRERPSRNPTKDQHRRHLEKLMEHPVMRQEKPVPIPESSIERKPRDPPDFVRFYMGSSAGAGSEVFHVYRHLRRRENDRQDYISAKALEEKLEDDFQQTLAMHRAEDNAKTAKKRAKRLKRKQRQKLAKKKGKGDGSVTGDSAQTDKLEEEESSDPEAEEEKHFIIGGK